MKKLLIALACAATSISSAGVAAPHSSKPAPIFSCSFGTKQVLVTGTPDAMTYQFGSLGNVEKTITAGRATGNVFYHADNMRYMPKQLRFTVGSTSYMLYHLEYADGSGAEYVQGLIVLQGTKKLANLKCRSGPGLDVHADYSSLPDDTAISLADYVN